jgi:hypothetical protein
MLNGTGVAILMLAGIVYAGKRVWQYSNNQ